MSKQFSNEKSYWLDGVVAQDSITCHSMVEWYNVASLVCSSKVSYIELTRTHTDDFMVSFFYVDQSQHQL